MVEEYTYNGPYMLWPIQPESSLKYKVVLKLRDTHCKYKSCFIDWRSAVLE